LPFTEECATTRSKYLPEQRQRKWFDVKAQAQTAVTQVPFADLAAQFAEIKTEVMPAVHRIMPLRIFPHIAAAQQQFVSQQLFAVMGHP